MNIQYEKLLEKAEEFKKKNIVWHHHYLSPNCKLSKSLKHTLILEANGESWKCYFDEKPMEELEKLENLFFNRI